MTETAHTVRGYAGLVSVAVQSLGFFPEQSLVMVCLTDSARLGPIGRIDLPEDASDEASFAAAVGDLVSAADQHADAVVLMLFTRAPARRAEFAERVADHFAGRIYPVSALLWVNDPGSGTTGTRLPAPGHGTWTGTCLMRS